MSATIQGPQDVRKALPFGANMVAWISNALRSAYPERHAAKRMASDADTPPRTVEAWRYGRNAPPSPELLLLMAANEAFEKEIISMVHAMRESGTCP